MTRYRQVQMVLLSGIFVILLLAGGIVSVHAEPVSKNLVLNYTWYHDSAYGNKVIDDSGRGNTGLNSHTVRTMTDTNSFYREFTNGSYISTEPFTQLTPPYTIEWYGIVDSDANNSSKRMVCDLGLTVGNYPIFSPNYLDTDEPAIILGSHNYKMGSTNLRDGKLHDVIFVVTGNGQDSIDTAKIYVDGVEESGYTVDKTGPATPPAAQLHIGAGALDGKTYLFRVYNNMSFNASQATLNYKDSLGRAGRSLQDVIDESVAKTGTYTFTRGYDGGSAGYTIYVPSNAIINGNGKTLRNISLTVKDSNNVTIRDVVNSGSRAPISPFSVIGNSNGVTFINCQVTNLRTGTARTSAFYVLPSVNSTISHLTIKDCRVDDTDSYGYTLWGNSDGARTISDVYIINSTANRCGYYARVNDWVVGFDLGEDLGDSLLTVKNVLVENSVASNNWESGFHMEGSTIAINVTVSDSTSYNNGVKPSAVYGSGFLLHGVAMNNDTAWNNSVAGYNLDRFPFDSPTDSQKNNPWLKAGSTLNNCKDIGSKVNLIIHGNMQNNSVTDLGYINVKNFTGAGAKINVMQVNDIQNINLINFTGTMDNSSVTPIFLNCTDNVTFKNLNINGGKAEAIMVRDDIDGRTSALSLINVQPNACITIRYPDDSTILIGQLDTFYAYHVTADGVRYPGWTMQDSSTIKITLMQGTHRYTLVPDSATYIWDNIPNAMNAGQTYPVSIVLRNDGNTAWSASDQFELGAVGDSSSDAALFGPVRLSLAPGTVVNPGQQYFWHFNMTAPTPATRSTYIPSYRMIWVGHRWFGDIANSVVTVSLPYDASVISNTMPATMHNATNYSVTIVMKNIGTENWTYAEGYALEAENISGNNAALFGPVRLSMAPGTVVHPGQQYTWRINMTAPGAIGKYYLSYRIARNGQKWLGQSANGTIWVGDGGSAQAYTVSLKAGWNLVSIPLVLKDDNIEHLFPDSERSHILVVWNYDEANGQWNFYTPQPGYDTNTLSTVDTQHGYWVYTDKDMSFSIQGTLPDASAGQMSKGWSLVGNPAMYKRDAASVYSNTLVVWGYKGGQWYFYTPQPGYDPNTLHSLEPGYGYWVYIE